MVSKDGELEGGEPVGDEVAAPAGAESETGGEVERGSLNSELTDVHEMMGAGRSADEKDAGSDPEAMAPSRRGRARVLSETTSEELKRPYRSPEDMSGLGLDEGEGTDDENVEELRRLASRLGFRMVRDGRETKGTRFKGAEMPDGRYKTTAYLSKPVRLALHMAEFYRKKNLATMLEEGAKLWLEREGIDYTMFAEE